MDTGKVCFGVDDTLRGLELGAVETLIVWENLDITRHVLRDASGKDVVVHTTAPPPTASNATAAGTLDGKAASAAGMSTTIANLSEAERAKFMDASTGLEMEQAQEPSLLLEWLAENYQTFGATLEFVTSKLDYVWRLPSVAEVASPRPLTGGQPICERVWGDRWSTAL